MAVQGVGVVAAGHPLSARAGAEALRRGGNAVDGALAALLTSFVAEPLLTGLGAGGYMLVAGAGRRPVLLDFFVAAPRQRPTADLEAVEVSFGDAVQIFHVGPASCAVYGVPAGIELASRRFGHLPLADHCERAAQLAEAGVPLNKSQAYVVAILDDLLRSSPEAAARWAPEGRLLGEGDRFRDEELAASLRLLGREGSDPFYRGELAQRVARFVRSRGGALDLDDLARYKPLSRAPLAVDYRGRRILTNPPPAAGGILLAYALTVLAKRGGRPDAEGLIEAMAAAQAKRDQSFLRGLRQRGFAKRFLAELANPGSTTHVAAIDGEGLACSLTTTNGEGSAVVVPGTGIHINNILGEADLNPDGFHRHPPGARLPSMMAPTVVVGEQGVELALGSAGSNRIRSAIMQTLVNVLDLGMGVQEAVLAPRIHLEAGVLYHEPGAQLGGWRGEVVGFRARNLFFGGVQVVARNGGLVEGAGDPRRGGDAAAA